MNWKDRAWFQNRPGLIRRRLWNADFVRHSIRTRARTRRRPRRCFSAFDFKDDDNTLHKANFNPRLDYGFFVLKCFTRDLQGAKS